MEQNIDYSDLKAKYNSLKKAKKENVEEVQKVSSEKPETLTLLNEKEPDNSNGTLILSELAEEEVNKTEEEKYIPPKSKKHLSPSVRKIVEENGWQVSYDGMEITL